MFSRKSEMNGPLPFQILIALLTRLSATSKTHVKTSPQKLNQSVSKCPITFLKSTQNNTFINQAIKNATSLSTNADSQERTRTSFWSVMLSSSISTQFTISIRTPFLLVLTNIPKVKFLCTNQVADQTIFWKYKQTALMSLLSKWTLE